MNPLILQIFKTHEYKSYKLKKKWSPEALGFYTAVVYADYYTVSLVSKLGVTSQAPLEGSAWLKIWFSLRREKKEHYLH